MPRQLKHFVPDSLIFHSQPSIMCGATGDSTHSLRDRKTGNISLDTFFGDSPFGNWSRMQLTGQPNHSRHSPAGRQDFIIGRTKRDTLVLAVNRPIIPKNYQ